MLGKKGSTDCGSVGRAPHLSCSFVEDSVMQVTWIYSTLHLITLTPVSIADGVGMSSSANQISHH